MRDPYSLLGVKRDAAVDEIKAAWRSKAKSLHPDINQDDPGATRRFAEVGQAYEVLKDPDRRRRYDRAADAHQTIMQQRDAARQAEERAKAARANAERVMEELARANAQRAQAQAGAASEAAEDMVERIFGEAAEAKAASGRRAGPSTSAQGQSSAQEQSSFKDQASAQSAHPGAQASDNNQAAGAEPEAPAAKPTPPLPIQAIELIASLMRRIRGETPPPEKAPDLLASANVSLDDMLKLNIVSLHLSDEREIRFPIEAGMLDGEEVRLKGQGLRLPGLQRGDLVVTVRVARDSRFHVEGHDLHTALAISLEDAVLGGEHEMETPGGKVPISVPAWSGSDQSITVPGLGLLKKDGERGDLIVELRVLLWDKPDAKVIDLMRHMRHGLFV